MESGFRQRWICEQEVIFLEKEVLYNNTYSEPRPCDGVLTFVICKLLPQLAFSTVDTEG